MKILQKFVILIGDRIVSQLSDQIAGLQTQITALAKAQADQATRESNAKSALQAQIDALNAQIQQLQAQINAGTAPTQADLDNLTAIGQSIQTVTNSLNAEDAPAAGEVPVSPTP